MDLFNSKKVKELEKTISKLECKINVVNEELSVAKEENENQKMFVNMIASRIGEMNSDLLLANEEKENYKLSIENLESEIGEKSNEIVAINEKNQNQKISMDNLENELDEISYSLILSKKENEERKLKISILTSKINEANGKLNLANVEIESYKELLTDEYGNAVSLSQKIEMLEEKEKKLLDSTAVLENEIQNLNERKILLDSEIIELSEVKLLQDFNLYEPMYDFATSIEFKERLSELRREQKDMIKDKTAATCSTSWTVNNSATLGNKMTRDSIRQALMIFNTECENVIDRVTFSNFKSMEERIEKLFDKLNRLNSTNNISISEEYLELKKQELALSYEYAIKKKEEKEELKMQREIQRENARVAKELEEERRRIDKEQQHYNNVMKQLIEQMEVEKNEQRLVLLREKKRAIEEELVELDKVLLDIDYREANQRAGYVYVISNIGAFGEDIYKIGMTRRLDPKVRVDELGGASVPFKFDVHAMIFTDDAPRLENKLHNTFADRAVNAINSRKEFFNVTLEEIEEVVKNNHDKTIDFVHFPQAQQFRESIKIRSSK